MIADIMIYKKFQATIKELFIRCRKLSISLAFITQSYFSVSKDVRLSSTHYLITKINIKRQLQSISINEEDLQRRFTESVKKKPFSFSTIDTTLPAGDPLRFRKNLFRFYKNDSN